MRNYTDLERIVDANMLFKVFPEKRNLTPKERESNKKTRNPPLSRRVCLLPELDWLVRKWTRPSLLEGLNDKTIFFCEKKVVCFLFVVKTGFPSSKKTKNPSTFVEGFYRCPSWIRTNIVGTKNRSPAIRRSGNFL
jgi:hypothetical protein